MTDTIEGVAGLLELICAGPVGWCALALVIGASIGLSQCAPVQESMCEYRASESRNKCERSFIGRKCDQKYQVRLQECHD